MCGISGLFSLDGKPVDRAALGAMAESMIERGPDDSGIFVSPSGQVGFGFRRLSIIDLDSGHQPMEDRETGNVIVSNGEIYNYVELRQQLQARGVTFATQSDTEVILKLYAVHGTDCVQHLRGMYAFAIYDRAADRLFLARDRMGKKPLYYYHCNGVFAFASTLQALLSGGSCPRQVNADIVPYYLAYKHCPSPFTMFKDVFSLPRASCLVVRNDGREPVPQRYWDVDYRRKTEIGYEEARERFREILAEAVRLRCRADVPVGALLSGGLDSSTIVALMAQQSAGPVRTFSASYGDGISDESPYIDQVVRRYGTDHTYLEIESIDLEAAVPRILRQLGQPMADAANIPLYFLCRKVASHVKTALTGDGGDENFGGYYRVQALSVIEAMRSGRPGLDWRLLRSVLGRVPMSLLRGPLVGLRKYATIIEALGRGSPYGVYDRLMTINAIDSEQMKRLLSPEFRQATAGTMVDRRSDLYQDAPALEETDRGLYCDLSTYLADYLNVKSDVMSMSNGLELRSPFLDSELIQFVATLPTSWKLDGLRRDKVMLRDIASELLPQSIITRPKVGFVTPLPGWLRETRFGKHVREVVLDGSRFSREMFVASEVQALVKRLMSGDDRSAFRVWILYVLEMWHHEVFPEAPGATSDLTVSAA